PQVTKVARRQSGAEHRVAPPCVLRVLLRHRRLSIPPGVRARQRAARLCSSALAGHAQQDAAAHGAALVRPLAILGDERCAPMRRAFEDALLARLVPDEPDALTLVLETGEVAPAAVFALVGRGRKRLGVDD